MCVAAAIPIAMGAISAAGTAAAYIGQQQQADAQSNFQSNTYKYVKKSATANYYQQVSQIENRVGQEKAAAGDVSMKDNLAGEKAKATAAATLGERGVTGNSVNALLGDFDRIEAQNHGALVTNLNWQRQQAGQDILAARAQALDRIHGATPQPVAYPSLLAAALQLGGTALKTYDTVQYVDRTGVYNQGNPNVPQRPLSTLI